VVVVVAGEKVDLVVGVDALVAFVPVFCPPHDVIVRATNPRIATELQNRPMQQTYGKSAE
jgi:hypothetical protein